MLLGYSMTLTDAPKLFGGRLLRNCARTTPELPWLEGKVSSIVLYTVAGVSLRSGDLAPDDANLRASDLLVRTIDESNTLA